MGHHDHRVATLEFNGELLDAPCGNRVEGARSLIHKQHLRLNRQRASDAQTLLLAARKRKGALLQTIFHFVENRRLAKRGFDDFVELSLALDAMGAWAERHVVVHAHRKRVRFLEHHANTSAKQVDVDFLAVEFFPIEPNRAFNSAAFDSVVHAIEAAQEGRLSAARRANERGDLIARHVHRYAVQRMERAIVQIEV